MSDLDHRLVDQLALHRGMHSLAAPLMAMLREMLLNEKLLNEVSKQPPSLKVTQSLAAIERYCELAENVTPEVKSWT